MKIRSDISFKAVVFCFLITNNLFAIDLPYRSGFFSHCYLAIKRRAAFTGLNSVEGKHGSRDRTSNQIKFLKNQPVRDIQKDHVSREFLKNHKFYISVTTSPKRISNLIDTLSTLDLTHVQKIYLSIPEKFGRDGSEYFIPDEIKNHSKIEIIRTEVDYGPATKIIPAAEKLKKDDPSAYLISIDDDTAYSRGMVNDYIYASAHMPGAAVGRSGVDVDSWNLSAKPLKKVPYERALNMTAVDSATPVDVLEGFAGVAYPVASLDTELIKEWSARCKECYLADDLVISLSLAKSGIPRVRYVSDYNRVVIGFDHAYQEDALHKGAGLERSEAPAMGSYNISNYLRTFDVLREDLESSGLIQ